MRILIYLLFSIVAVDFSVAGCDIDLRVKNETKYAITLADHSRTLKASIHSSSFQVKTKGVPWRSVGKGGWDTMRWADAGTLVESYRWLEAGDEHWVKRGSGIYVLESGKTAVGRYAAVLGCGVKRRYRLRFTCHEVGEIPFDFSLGFTDENVAQKNHYFPGPKQWTEGSNVTIPIKSCK